MISTPIRARDEILIRRPAREIWPVVADLERYPTWWPKSLGVRVLTGGKDLLGAEVEVRPVCGRPFRCRVESVDEQHRIQMRYFGGLIDGLGEWRLEPAGPDTRVIYTLEAKANGWLVVQIGKVLDLARLHSRQMLRVLQNLDNVLSGGGEGQGEGTAARTRSMSEIQHGE